MKKDKCGRNAKEETVTEKKTSFLKCPFCGNTKSATWVVDKEYSAGGMVFCNAATDQGLGGCGASTGWAEDEKAGWVSWERRS